MSRRTRINVPGCLYHVIARGNSRQQIFFAERDYLAFLALLSAGMARYGHRLHAYCLMTNHVHLLLQMGEVSISVLAQQVLSRYARWQNRKLGRSGHLFERRHHSVLVTTNEQLLCLLQYIHQNPLRAGMVTECAAYRWSSHHAYLGGAADVEVTTSTSLDRDPNRAGHRYRALIEGDREASTGAAPDGHGADLPALEPSQVARLGVTTPGKSRPGGGELEALIAATAATSGCSPSELLGPSMARPIARARAAVALLVMEHPRLGLGALAASLGRDPSTLGEAARRFEKRLGYDEECRGLWVAVHRRWAS